MLRGDSHLVCCMTCRRDFRGAAATLVQSGGNAATETTVQNVKVRDGATANPKAQPLLCLSYKRCGIEGRNMYRVSGGLGGSQKLQGAPQLFTTATGGHRWVMM